MHVHLTSASLLDQQHIVATAVELGAEADRLAGLGARILRPTGRGTILLADFGGSGGHAGTVLLHRGADRSGPVVRLREALHPPDVRSSERAGDPRP
jgi:hypothetical protein